MSPPEGLDVAPKDWEIIASALARYLAGVEVWAFGSRATGKARRYSDLDLAIVSRAPLSLSVRSALEEDLCESPLPFKVDIVDLVSASEGFRGMIIRTHLVAQRGQPANR